MRNAQIEHHDVRLEGERLLWTAVLIEAVRDLLGIDRNSRPLERARRSRVQYFTRLWFLSDRRNPGSFLWICDQLELDPEWLRRRILQMADREERMSPDVNWRMKRQPAVREEEKDRARAAGSPEAEMGDQPTTNARSLVLLANEQTRARMAPLPSLTDSKPADPPVSLVPSFCNGYL